ncbi:MAG: FtsW/RodA/SpoVE family cell cycle protein [Clostridia bacterium]|nr:FtsW/RodA/SpoVE family cell cycle protein [Clostridia bacterium]
MKSFIKETDKIMLVLCVILSAAGILFVQTAAAHGERFPLTRDAIVMAAAVALGIAAAIAVSALNTGLFLRFWPIIAAVSIGLMIITLMFGVGPPSRADAKTWLSLGGTGLYFQPSELVKIGFIITFSAHLERVKDNLNKIRYIIQLTIHGAIPAGLVVISGDMGSALIFIIIFACMMFAAGLRLRWIAAGAGAVVLVTPLIWRFVMTDIQKDRINALFNPEDYPDIMYQQNQGLKAIWSGGLTGSGLFRGYYTNSKLVPEGENDMIFATIGEQAGIIGCFAVLILFALLIFRIVRIGSGASDRGAYLVCSGIAAMIGSQVIVNVGMVLRLLPVIGITLPFLSAGGSSNLCIYLAVGLVLGCSRYRSADRINSYSARGMIPAFG